jgi:hypothetical protein
MKFEDRFSNIDDKTAERLSAKYPLPDEERKARLYTMSKRKYDGKIEPEKNEIEVSGVDKYRRPKWYRSVSVAAAAVLVIAGIGTSTFLISRNGKDKSPAASISDNTTAAATETIIESATEAISEGTINITEADANEIAKKLVDAYTEYLGDLFGGTIEVDKTKVITKEYPEMTKEYYLITDKRYPNWKAVEKRCYEIFESKYAKKLLDDWEYSSDEGLIYGPFMYSSAEGDFFVEKEHYEDNNGPIKWDQDQIKAEYTSDGEITVTLTSTVNVEQTIQTVFTMVNTDDGWRISKADESMASEDEPDSVANELVSAYSCFFTSYCTGDLEYDKSDVITKDLVSSEDGSNITREYYRVTDSRLLPGYDLKGDCFEIFDDELANSMYEQICCDEDNVTDKTPIIKRKDGSYYIAECFYYEGDKLESWDQDTIRGTLNPDGTITTVLSKTFEDVTTVEEFTFVNTEYGWRISKVNYTDNKK